MPNSTVGKPERAPSGSEDLRDRDGHAADRERFEA
jgi:hypothetical protein